MRIFFLYLQENQSVPKFESSWTLPNAVFYPLRCFPWPLQTATIDCCSFVGLSAFSFLSSTVSKNHAQLGWLTWTVKSISFLCLMKLLSCFHSLFWVFIHLHCEELPYYHNISLNLSIKYNFIHFRIHPVTFISSHISDKHCSRKCPWKHIHHVSQILWYVLAHEPLFSLLLIPSFWNELFMVSSVQRTLFHNCVDFLSKGDLAFLFLSGTCVSRHEIKPLYFHSWRCLLIVDHDTPTVPPQECSLW